LFRYVGRQYSLFVERFANTVVGVARYSRYNEIKELKIIKSALINGVLSVIAGLSLAILLGSISKSIFWILLIFILIYWVVGGLIIFIVVSTKLPRFFMAVLMILILIGGGIFVLLQRFENPAPLLCVYGGTFLFFCFIFLRSTNKIISDRLSRKTDKNQ
jgi:hypothetical protein